MSENKVKQVIVIRQDLGMRRGKEIAQGSHASMLFLLEHIKTGVPFSEAERHWVDVKMTKICVKVSSEAELLEVHREAEKAGLRSHLILDAGLTEFGSEPTLTCCAIGPDFAERLNPVTSHLQLL